MPNHWRSHPRGPLPAFTVSTLGSLALLLATADGCALVWSTANHKLLAVAAAVVGLLTLAAYAVSMADGRTRPMWWHGFAMTSLPLCGFAYLVMPR